MTTQVTVLEANQRMAIDTLIRRELKVGDPNDPQQIAKALAERYQSDARAQAISGEAMGLPFLNTPVARLPDPSPRTASDVDLEQARNDVKTDLEHLLTSNLTKDIRPELEGWQTVIRRAIDEGIAAARVGLDPRRRDVAFSMRRQLGEYARLSRMIGALTPALNRSFRSLAMSLDEVSAVMLVLMGESMANLGFSGGRFLLQTEHSELQARRDAALNALRQVDGATTVSGTSWQRGLRAYRRINYRLDSSGQADLRSLMSQGELARTLDELIQLASGGTPQGLRAIGSTAWAPLNRLHRFVRTTLGLAPASPELAALHEALILFLEGFVPAGGFRLLRIARPSVLNYGLYGSADMTLAERRLIELVNRRGTFARSLDCLMQCGCDDDTVRLQIVLDKILYDLDRAIDYYCMGDEDLGVPELRAAAFSHLIDAILPVSNNYPLLPNAGIPVIWPWNRVLPIQTLPRPGFLTGVGDGGDIANQLNAIRSLLRPRGTTAAPGLVANPYPQADWWRTTETRYNDDLCNNSPLPGGPEPQNLAQVLHDEICLQRATDVEWRMVVEQMTSGCTPVGDIFDDEGCLMIVLDRALNYLDVATHGQVPSPCNVNEPGMPAHIEDSMERIAGALQLQVTTLGAQP